MRLNPHVLLALGICLIASVGGCPTGTPITGPNTGAPNAVAGDEQVVYSGDKVWLDATQSRDPDNNALVYAWSQTGGPNVELRGQGSEAPTFTAPAVSAESVLAFDLVVSDGLFQSTATTRVIVIPAPVATSNSVRVVGTWTNSSDHWGNGGLAWALPNGGAGPATGTGTDYNGTMTSTAAASAVADGLHWLGADFQWLGGTNHVITYDVDFLGYSYSTEQVILEEIQRFVILDVQKEAARVAFNGWLPSSERDSGFPTGYHAVEIQGAWRDVTNFGSGVDINLQLPDGTWVEKFSTGTPPPQGFTRIVLDEENILPGDYRLTFFVGTSEQSEVTYIIKFFNVLFRFDGPMIGSNSRDVLINVDEDGIARIISSDWD
jgi:hypothetical protein